MTEVDHPTNGPPRWSENLHVTEEITISTLTRSQFNDRLANREIDLRNVHGVSASHMQALRRADLDRDGKIDGANEINAAFTALDDFDRNGSRHSVDAGTAARPTAIASTVNALQRAPDGDRLDRECPAARVDARASTRSVAVLWR